MKSYIADWIAAAFLVAVVFMLVKPGSTATQAIDAFSGALSSLIKTAVGSNSSTTGTTGTNGAQQ